MPRDYSSRRGGSTNRSDKTKQRPAARRKAAARPARQRAARRGPPGWLWFICGLCLATAGAAGLYIFARPVGHAGPQQVAIDRPNGTPQARAGSAHNGGGQAGHTQAPEQKPRFAFYKMLPDYHVSVTRKKHAAHSGGGRRAGPSRAPPVDSPRAATPKTPEPKANRPGSYIIQAGSFSTHADADQRKAKLALLGVSSRIVAIDLASGKTVYRVQSEPIGSSDRLDDLLKRLRANRIDTMVRHAKNQ